MQEQEIVAEFDYRPGRIKAVLLTCLVLAGVGLVVYFAFNLAQPIAVLGIQFTARQGRIFFGVFACLSVIGVVPMAGMVHLAFIGKRRVALTATAILAPRPTRFGLSREEIAIPFESIRSAELRPFVHNTKFFRIEHQGGVLPLFSNMLRHPKQFSQLCEMIQQAVRMTRSEESM